MQTDPFDPFRFKRDAMIADQLIARGISSARVLHAMAAVPRHRFVRDDQRDHAYDDNALPSLSGQTISQPYIVAYMTQLLDVQPAHRVLEIGTGTGYQTGILAALADRGEVFTIERIRELSDSARALLAELGFANIHYLVSDGSLGWPEPCALQAGDSPGVELPSAQFDRILIAAGTPEVPAPLLRQLADGGILIAPRGRSDSQQLISVTRHGSAFSEHRHIPVRFVPLIGKHGWQNESA